MQTGQKGKGGMPMNQKGLAAKLVKLNHITHKIVLFIAQASILAMVAIVTLTVILRYCPVRGSAAAPGETAHRHSSLLL